MRKIIEGDVNLSKLHFTELIDLSDVEVTGDFNCNKNNLTSLKGGPQVVGNSYQQPAYANSSYFCGRNNLTNLEGAPKKVNGGFFCRWSNLTSLSGAPTIVTGAFFCDDNNLDSLDGSPHTIHNNFHCSGNQLTNIEGMPKRIYGHIYLPLSVKNLFSITYVRSLSEIRGMVLYI